MKHRIFIQQSSFLSVCFNNFSFNKVCYQSPERIDKYLQKSLAMFTFGISHKISAQFWFFVFNRLQKEPSLLSLPVLLKFNSRCCNQFFLFIKPL
jgi:hypothetical protein